MQLICDQRRPSFGKRIHSLIGDPYDIQSSEDLGGDLVRDCAWIAGSLANGATGRRSDRYR